MNAIEKIGIFKGRERIYNKLILEALFLDGPLTSWELAKKVYERMRRTRRLPKNWKGSNGYHVTQKINSVFTRKKSGRLQELFDKRYLAKGKKKNGDSWTLTPKGRIAALIHDRSLVNKVSREDWNKRIETVNQKRKEALKELGEVRISFLGQTLKMNLDAFGDLLSGFTRKFASKGGLLGFISRVESAIEKGGLNLDAISEQDLMFLFGTSDDVISFVEKKFEAEKVLSHD